MRIFVTHVLSHSAGQQHGISIAATNFSHNLLSGGGFDKCYSILPTFVSETDGNECPDDIELVFFKGLRRLGRLGRIASVLIEQWKLFRKIPKNANVWLYNITPLNTLLIRLLKRFKPSVRIYPIVLDFTPGIHDKYLPLINNSDGRVLLANSNRFNQINAVCMPGVVPIDDYEKPLIKQCQATFLLSGKLLPEISMLPTVLDAFSKIPDAQLIICGQECQDESQVLETANRCPNIKYLGNITFSEYMQLLHNCTFVLSTRDYTFPENECNFPSKIIEALSHNRIVLSTIDYPSLNNINYFRISHNSNEMAKDIKNIISMPEKELLKYANQQSAVKILFSVNEWNKVMTNIEKQKL